MGSERLPAHTIDVARFGPWALVTGASSGIGREFARQLAAHGIHLVVAARRGEELKALASELERDHGVECRCVPVDLSRSGTVSVILDATRDLDVGLVVSNAGSGTPGEFLASTDEDLHATVQLNAISQLDLAHHFAHALVERGRGGLLLVGAMGASEGIPLMANAGATKAFVHSLGQALHLELAPRGVTVTVLVPGPTDTPVLAKFGIKNLPMKPVSAERCVTEALRALQGGRSSILPGRALRVLVALMPASAARSMTMKMFAKALEHRE